MLNCYYLYAIVWTVVIILYDFGWSDYCSPLDTWLRFFIYFSVIVCFFLGWLTKNRFKWVSSELKVGNLGTILICAIQLFEYYYCGEIPLISVISGRGSYTDFAGIPTLHVVIYTYAIFYTQYLFFAFLNKHKFRYIRNYFIILFVVYVLQFMRGGLTICIAISSIMLISSLQNRFKLKHLVLLVIGVVSFLYLFGIIGNIRHGANWNDNSAFFVFARINEQYPSWLPGQFAWVYAYIVGSLATLNKNIILRNTQPNIVPFIQSIIPDFIEKRLWPNRVVGEPILLSQGFNTTTGYYDSFYHGGIVGIFIMFMTIILLSLIVVRNNRVKEKYKIITLANISVIMSLFFFTNSIHNSAVSFSIVYPIVFSLLRYKICFRRKYLNTYISDNYM